MMITLKEYSAMLVECKVDLIIKLTSVIAFIDIKSRFILFGYRSKWKFPVKFASRMRKSINFENLAD